MFDIELFSTSSENIRHLLVVEHGKLVGIVTDKDIYHAIVKSESLIASLIADELLIGNIDDLQLPQEAANTQQRQAWRNEVGQRGQRRLFPV